MLFKDDSDSQAKPILTPLLQSNVQCTPVGNGKTKLIDSLMGYFARVQNMLILPCSPIATYFRYDSSLLGTGPEPS